MKARNWLVLAALAAAVPGWSQDAAAKRGGSEAGNGGVAIVSRNANGHLEYGRCVQLLDLYEAEKLYELKIPSQSGTVDEVVDRVLGRLTGIDSAAGVRVWKTLDALKTQVRYLDDVELDLTNDALPVFKRHGWNYEQLAVFNEHGLLINQELYKGLASTDGTLGQAALFVHEAIYKVAREVAKVTNSKRARKLVGLLFSDRPENDPETRMLIDEVLKGEIYEGPAPQGRLGRKYTLSEMAHTVLGACIEAKLCPKDIGMAAFLFMELEPLSNDTYYAIMDIVDAKLRGAGIQNRSYGRVITNFKGLVWSLTHSQRYAPHEVRR